MKKWDFAPFLAFIIVFLNVNFVVGQGLPDCPDDPRYFFEPEEDLIDIPCRILSGGIECLTGGYYLGPQDKYYVCGEKSGFDCPSTECKGPEINLPDCVQTDSDSYHNYFFPDNSEGYGMDSYCRNYQGGRTFNLPCRGYFQDRGRHYRCVYEGAWNHCMKGERCKAPEDLIPEEELMSKTVQEVADTYGIESSVYAMVLSNILSVDVSPNENLGDLQDNYDLETSDAAAAKYLTNPPYCVGDFLNAEWTNDYDPCEDIELWCDGHYARIDSGDWVQCRGMPDGSCEAANPCISLCGNNRNDGTLFFYEEECDGDDDANCFKGCDDGCRCIRPDENEPCEGIEVESCSCEDCYSVGLGDNSRFENSVRVEWDKVFWNSRTKICLGCPEECTMSYTRLDDTTGVYCEHYGDPSICEGNCDETGDYIEDLSTEWTKEDIIGEFGNPKTVREMTWNSFNPNTIPENSYRELLLNPLRVIMEEEYNEMDTSQKYSLLTPSEKYRFLSTETKYSELITYLENKRDTSCCQESQWTCVLQPDNNCKIEIDTASNYVEKRADGSYVILIKPPVKTEGILDIKVYDKYRLVRSVPLTPDNFELIGLEGNGIIKNDDGTFVLVSEESTKGRKGRIRLNDERFLENPCEAQVEIMVCEDNDLDAYYRFENTAKNIPENFTKICGITDCFDEVGELYDKNNAVQGNVYGEDVCKNGCCILPSADEDAPTPVRWAASSEECNGLGEVFSNSIQCLETEGGNNPGLALAGPKRKDYMCGHRKYAACGTCVNSGAQEVCDGVDNDCNGEIDEQCINPDGQKGICIDNMLCVVNISAELTVDPNYLAHMPINADDYLKPTEIPKGSGNFSLIISPYDKLMCNASFKGTAIAGLSEDQVRGIKIPVQFWLEGEGWLIIFETMFCRPASIQQDGDYWDIVYHCTDTFSPLGDSKRGKEVSCIAALNPDEDVGLDVRSENVITAHYLYYFLPVNTPHGNINNGYNFYVNLSQVNERIDLSAKKILFEKVDLDLSKECCYGTQKWGDIAAWCLKGTCQTKHGGEIVSDEVCTSKEEYMSFEFMYGLYALDSQSKVTDFLKSKYGKFFSKSDNVFTVIMDDMKTKGICSLDMAAACIIGWKNKDPFVVIRYVSTDERFGIITRLAHEFGHIIGGLCDEYKLRYWLGQSPCPSPVGPHVDGKPDVRFPLYCMSPGGSHGSPDYCSGMIYEDAEGNNPDDILPLPNVSSSWRSIMGSSSLFFVKPEAAVYPQRSLCPLRNC